MHAVRQFAFTSSHKRQRKPASANRRPRAGRTAKQKASDLQCPRLCTYARITGFGSHAWLVSRSCLSSCKQAVCASALCPSFSFIRLGCESVLLVQRGRLSVQSLQFGGWLRFPTRLPELLIAASLRSSDQASFFCRLRGEVKSFPFGRLLSICSVV